MKPPLLSPRHPLAVLGLGAAVLAGVLRVLTVLYLAPIFDNVLVKQDVASLPRVLVVAGGIAALGALMLFLQDLCMGTVAARVTAQWRETLHARR
jgi:ABC-type bacteriocin/lantibiotic exporter with double-glycine peptidase domain